MAMALLGINIKIYINGESDRLEGPSQSGSLSVRVRQVEEATKPIELLV